MLMVKKQNQNTRYLTKFDKYIINYDVYGLSKTQPIEYKSKIRKQKKTVI